MGNAIVSVQSKREYVQAIYHPRLGLRPEDPFAPAERAIVGR